MMYVGQLCKMVDSGELCLYMGVVFDNKDSTLPNAKEYGESAFFNDKGELVRRNSFKQSIYGPDNKINENREWAFGPVYKDRKIYLGATASGYFLGHVKKLTKKQTKMCLDELLLYKTMAFGECEPKDSTQLVLTPE